jgi:hypothetical protein
MHSALPAVSTCTGVSAQPPTEIRLRFADVFASVSKVFFVAGHSSRILPALPENGFYEDHATLVVILCTLQQSFLTNCCFSNVGVYVVFYIERFIPKLVPAKDTLRTRHRDTPSFDTPVALALGEGARQKILVHQVFNRSVDLGQV